MKKIRFLHIPKTAGTTFETALGRIYQGNQFIFSGVLPQDLEKYSKLPPEEVERIALFTGHAPLITGVEEIDSIPTITLLRNPVERVKSFCQHVREGKSPYLLKKFPPENFDLNGFLYSGNLELNNLHARNILGIRDFNIPDLNHEELVVQAVDLLQSYLLAFGIVEYFDESLLLLRRKLVWPWPLYQRLNVKDESRVLFFESDHIQRIRELNSLDIAIYNRAREIFEESLKTYSNYLETNLPKFRLRQKLYQNTTSFRHNARRIIQIFINSTENRNNLPSAD